MTYTGSTTNTVSTGRKIRRVHRKEPGAVIGDRAVRCPRVWLGIGGLSSAGGEQQVDARDDEEEEQQQHGHGGAGAEVPRLEGRLVDVEGDQVGGLGRRLAEEHERCVEV